MKRILSFAVIAAAGFLSLAFAMKDDGTTSALPKAASAADIQPRGFSHKVGSLWTQVTNYGFYGDKKYVEPNFEWPGGSGNIYGWLTSIWIGAQIDSAGYVSCGESNHFRPLDSIHVKTRSTGALSAEDTYTRYTDVNPPNPGAGHHNLGVEIIEHTYAWDQSYNDDFIICDYWIKNVGDSTSQGIVRRTLNGVYVAFRMDADVSGFNGSNTESSLWDGDDLVAFDPDNKLFYLYDADNPTVPGDDTGNPDPVTGVLRSPGYIGARLLKADSAHFGGRYTGEPTIFSPTYRYNEPLSTTGQYEFLKGSVIAPNATVTRDYRGIFGIGPFTIPAGDSIHIVIAWVIGYGKAGCTLNSQVAQSLFDGNYSKAPSAPDEPRTTIKNSVDAAGIPSVELKWRRNSEYSADPLTGLRDFAGYAVYKSTRQDAGGNPIWDTLAVYIKGDKLDRVKDSLWLGRPFVKPWPPEPVVEENDTLYRFLDRGILNGMIYTYAVTAFDGGDSLLGIGRLENQIGRGRATTKIYMANNPPAENTNKIRVVPNPFLGSSKFNNPNPIETNPWVNRIRFINLPLGARISIFTLAGDLVKTIGSGDVVYTSRDVAITGDFSGVAEWDLVTKNNQEVVSGIYIYVVESDAGSFTGRFTVIR